MGTWPEAKGNDRSRSGAGCHYSVVVPQCRTPGTPTPDPAEATRCHCWAV